MYMGCLLRMLIYGFSGKKFLFHFQASGGGRVPFLRELNNHNHHYDHHYHRNHQSIIELRALRNTHIYPSYLI
jgi:hypothetical protein